MSDISNNPVEATDTVEVVVQTGDNEPEEQSLVTLVDEQGVERVFTLIDMVEHNGNEYALLAPLSPLQDGEELPADEEDEVLILRVITEETHSRFEMIENEEEFNQVVDLLESLFDQPEEPPAA